MSFRIAFYLLATTTALGVSLWNLHSTLTAPCIQGVVNTIFAAIVAMCSANELILGPEADEPIVLTPVKH